jgi:hypothetical protein
MLAVLMLRRLAYTLFVLFRAVTQRSDENRAMRWDSLLPWVRDALVAAGDEHLAGLRARQVAAAHARTGFPPAAAAATSRERAGGGRALRWPIGTPARSLLQVSSRPALSDRTSETRVSSR